MATDLVYPERKRCRRCRRYLGQTVVLGLFCSYRCASTPDPTTKAADAPRECRRRPRVGETGWAWKTRYLSLREVDENLLLLPGDSIYRCGNCGFLHVGHRRADVALFE